MHLDLHTFPTRRSSDLNVNRERDFTLTKLKTKRPNRMGGGRNFLNFIEKELIPFIDKNYRTEPNRILVGHSLGGLLTLNSYMDRSEEHTSELQSRENLV